MDVDSAAPSRLQSRPQSHAAQSRPRAAETAEHGTQTDARHEGGGDIERHEGAAPATERRPAAAGRAAGAEATELPPPSQAELEAAAALIQGAAPSARPTSAGPALDPEQQQRAREREVRAKNLTLSRAQQQLLAQRLEALSAALEVGALSPALYEQARRELAQ